MLKILRKRKRSWMISLVLGAIILVFIFWGIGTLKVDKRNTAARVNGKPITSADYVKAYQQQLNYYRNMLKDQFSDELLEKLNLKQNTIQTLINTELQLQEAKKQDIFVSTEEVQKTISSVQAFQKDGAFDKALYLQVLKTNRILPGDYEKKVEDALVLEKLHKKVTEAANVPDKEIEDAFASENRKVNLQYAVIDSSKFEKGIMVADEEAKAYYEKNKDALKDLFKAPTKVKALYVSIPFKDISKKIKISDAEVKEYYEKNLNEFQTQKEVSARHILIKTAADASGASKTKEDAKKKAEEILSLIKKGKDFADLAKKYSEDTGSAKQGGSLGYFRQGDMVKPFENAAFALKKGEVSGIVETQYGFHIIKVEDIKEARLIPLKEARNMIIKKLSEAGAKKLAKDTASDVEKTVVVEKQDLKDAANMKKLKIKETGFFAEHDAGAELTKDAELAKNIFSLKKGETSGALETSDAVYIVKILDRKEEHMPDYDEAAISVKTAMVKTKAKEKAKEAADAVLKRFKQGEDMHKLASKEGYKTGETGFFTKSEGYISSINLYVGDKPEIFSLNKENPYYNQTIPHADKFYVFRLKNSQEADKTNLEAKKNEIKNRLLQRKQQEAFDKWLTDLKSKAKIEINKEAL